MTKSASPFDLANYRSQIKPHRRQPFRVPVLQQPPSRDSLAPASEQPQDRWGKTAALLRARI
jgi:hypothetical protein